MGGQGSWARSRSSCESSNDQRNCSVGIRRSAMLLPLLETGKTRRAPRMKYKRKRCDRKLTPLAASKTTSNNVINLNCTLMSTIMIVLLLLHTDARFHLGQSPWARPRQTAVEAVSVERLQVPDLVVIDQHQSRMAPALNPFAGGDHPANSSANRAPGIGSLWPGPRDQAGPQAASLINAPLAATEAAAGQQQITFECLVSYDTRRDKNLIVKWHHDKRTEPIYQWIPELGKRSIAPQYRPYIAPITGQQPAQSEPGGGIVAGPNGNSTLPTGNQIQLLEAGFRLIKPTKELGGRYTCSAISSQNDDSKTKKMIVYTPPKSFTFNATRADIGALLASQRDRLAQQMQPPAQAAAAQLPPAAYRSRDLTAQPTTISPQMYSTIDYVNVNQQRARQQQQQQQQQSSSSPMLRQYPQPQQVAPARYLTHFNRTSQAAAATAARQPLGVKLVCDIDQVFPVLEVSIYRLARPDGSHPEKLAKLDTRIERDAQSGLFHVQVTSILDDDELALIRRQQQQEASDDIYFECLIALTNLELSKYADNKRSIIYRPGQQRELPHHHQDSATLEQLGDRSSTATPSSSSSSSSSFSVELAPVLVQIASIFIGSASMMLHRAIPLWQLHSRLLLLLLLR